jgi:endo-1,4-beta-D-glucanase Y
MNALRICSRLRLRVLLIMAGLLICLPSFAAAHKCTAGDWPFWEAWASRYVQKDGRVLESSMQENHSTSEGQAYNMLFALIGNDPERFDHLWTWTVANMLGSDLDQRLPGWLWGQGKDGQWQLQDANSASDADLWMAYALLEAARLWQRPDYRKDGLRLLATIRSKLVVDLPGLGKMVLPGPESFVQRNILWTLNPSYLPLPLLRRLAKEDPAGPWKQVADNTVRMIQSASPRGYVPDWVRYRMTAIQSGQFMTEPGKGEMGSYDAIRVYLWAGMTAKKDPGFAPLMTALQGMTQAMAATAIPPEKVQVSTGALEGQAPFGFSGALLPYFMAQGDLHLAEQLQRHARESIKAAFPPGSQPTEAKLLYYNVMLSLFGLGWAEKRYQFRADGTLKLSWEKSCERAVLR